MVQVRVVRAGVGVAQRGGLCWWRAVGGGSVWMGRVTGWGVAGSSRRRM